MTGGQTFTAAAPRERMPLFVRAGAIIPTGPDVQWTGENPQGPLTVHVFAGADGRFTLYEDAGTDMGYARAEFARIPIDWNESSRTLTLGTREGSFPGMSETRLIIVILHEGRENGEVFDERKGPTLTYEGKLIALVL